MITSGNEETHFNVGYESGIVNLAKPVTRPTDLEITANDHGSPPRKAVLKLSLIPVTTQISGPPRLLLSNPIARISENLHIGASVLNVAESTITDQGKKKKCYRNCSYIFASVKLTKFDFSLRNLWSRLNIKLLSVNDIHIIEPN